MIIQCDVFYFIIMKKEMLALFDNSAHLNFKTETIKDLQSRLSSKKTKKVNEAIKINKSNSNLLNVSSPFYDRNKICHLKNCFCPYHKRIKHEIIRKKYDSMNRKNSNTATNSPSIYKKQNKQPRPTHHPFIINYHTLQSINEKIPNYKDIPGKLQSFNIQYQRFLKMFNSLFKETHGGHGNHIVKTPVWKIFNYIYHHLDDEREHIQGYIDSLEKDREVKTFYLERYQDLKMRKNNGKMIKMSECHQNSSIKQKIKKSFKPYQTSKYQSNFTQNSNKNITKIHEKRKKSQKSAKLIIQILINQLRHSQQIQQKHLSIFISLSESQFLSNITYLKNKLPKINNSLLESIKVQILEVSKDKLELQLLSDLQNEEIKSKIKLLSEMINDIDEELNKNLEQQQKDSFSEESQEQRVRGNVTLKKDSQMKNSRNKSSFGKQKIPNELKRLMDANVNTSVNIPSNVNISKQNQKVDFPKQQKNEFKQNQRNRTTIQFQYDDFISYDQIQGQQIKDNRINSHGVFERKKYLTNIYFDQKQNVMTLEKLKNLEDVQNYLQQLKQQSSNFKAKMQDIQAQLTPYNIDHLMLKADQDLITIKRKIRVIKLLIKDQNVTQQLKHKLKQYLIFAEKLALAKNHNWAYLKLKHIIMNNNQVQLFEQEEQDLNSFMKQLLSGIFTEDNRLYFYHLEQTQYFHKNCHFQANFYDSIKNNKSKDENPNKDPIKISFKRFNYDPKQKKKRNDQKSKPDADLVQVGLDNRFQSEYNYDQTINHRTFESLHTDFINPSVIRRRQLFWNSSFFKK